MRVMTYMLLFFTQLCMNLDSGSIPASLTALSEDPLMRLNLTEQGALGSCVYAGMIFGSILSAPCSVRFRRISGSSLRAVREAGMDPESRFMHNCVKKSRIYVTS